jgi:hypothetical protein
MDGGKMDETSYVALLTTYGTCCLYSAGRYDFDGGKSISRTIVLALFLFCFHWFAFCNTTFRFQKTVQVSVNEWVGFNSLPVEKK